MIDQERERDLLRQRLLGWGLACPLIDPGLDLGRDIGLVVGPGGRDFARVSALDNLFQDLSVALTTLLGSDIFNTDFGFDGLNALVEESNPIMVRERVRVAIIQLLRKDPRIRRIVDVKLADGQLETPTPGSRELNVRVEFETVSGEQLSLNFGKVMLNG